MWGSLIGVFSNDLAIDLGTANTLIYVKSRRHRLQRAVRSSRCNRRKRAGRQERACGRARKPSACWAALPAASSPSGR